MAIVLIEPDPFIGLGSEVVSYIPDYRNDSGDTSGIKADIAQDTFGFNAEEIQAVSRPLNGIAVKPNTHAFVQVIKSDKTVVKVFNQLGLPALYAQSGEGVTSDGIQELLKGGTGTHRLHAGGKGSGLGQSGRIGDAIAMNARLAAQSGGDSTKINSASGMGIDAEGNPAASAWTDWILQGVREARMEKTQVVETFGDSYLYAFGEKPRVLAFQGLLMNSADYNWRAVFWENWDKFFRASKLIQMDARIYIGWEDIIVEGYPLSANCQESAQSPNAMQFSFNLYVTNYFNMSMANRRTMASRSKLYSLGMSRSRPQGTDVFEATLTDKRFSTYENILGANATGSFWGKLDNVSSDGYVLDADGNKTDEKLDEWQLLGIRSAKKVASMATKVASGAHISTGGSQLLSFLNANLLQLGYDAAKTAWKVAEDKLDKGWGPFSSSSDFNAWFGYAGNVVNNIMDQTSGRWDGTRTDFGGVGSSLLDMFRMGSMDRIVQRMSYQTVGLLGIPSGRARASTLSNDNTSSFEAWPGAATIIHEQTPDFGSSTVDLSSLSDALDTDVTGADQDADPLADPFGLIGLFA